MTNRYPSEAVTINILQHQFTIKCSPEETTGLKQAAKHLEKTMSQLKQSGPPMDFTQTILVAALNITHNFLNQNRQRQQQVQHTNARIRQLQDKVENALTLQAELEV